MSFVSPVLRRGEQVVAGNLNWGTLVQGVAPEFQQIREWQVAEGRFLHDGDVENDAKVAVLGETVVRNLFGNDDPLESVIRIRNIPFRVVGVLAAKGQSSQGADQDDTVLIPYTSMQKRLMRITNVQTIIASAVTADRVQEAQVGQVHEVLLDLLPVSRAVAFARVHVLVVGVLEHFVDALAVPSEHVTDREQLTLVGPRAGHHATVGDAVQEGARRGEAQLRSG